MHVFPDAAAMAAHFEGSEERSLGAASLIVPAGFEVYGRAPAGASDRLLRDASEAGIGVDKFAEPVGGFLRAP